MRQNLADRFAELPDLLAGHLLLSLSALVIGVGLSVPLGVLATRRPRLRGPALGVTSLIQTIPSMALLALMVPVLGGMIGFVPAFVALTLYSMLPVLRNTVTGIDEVDATLTEAARGVGMTDRQSLLRVELPLAAPVIIAGIRTATVWVVGMATLSTPVGAPSLGNYIFLGLQTRNWVAVLFGCFFAAALAVVLDQLIRALEHAARRRSRRIAAGAGIALAAIVIGGLLPLAGDVFRGTATAAPRRGGELAAAPEPGGPTLSGQTLLVGSKGFTEQYILSALLQQQLEASGATVRARPNMGSTILFDALRNDTVDVCIDYTGTIWTTIMKRDEPISPAEMLIEVASHLKNEHGVITLGRLGFENAYALAMSRDRAQALGTWSIADLADHAGELTIGGDPEFFGRPEWTRVREIYGLGGLRTRGMDSTFMYGAARDGEVDVITAYSTDGRVAAFDLVVLRDPEQAFPPYDGILLLSPRAARNAAVVEALLPLVNAVSNEAMRDANMRVDIDKRPAGEVAEHLRAQIMRR